MLRGGGRTGEEIAITADAKNKKNNENRYRSETFFWSFIKAILFSHLSLSLEHVCQVNNKKKKATRNLESHSTSPEKKPNVLTIYLVLEVSHAAFKLAPDP